MDTALNMADVDPAARLTRTWRAGRQVEIRAVLLVTGRVVLPGQVHQNVQLQRLVGMLQQFSHDLGFASVAAQLVVHWPETGQVKAQGSQFGVVKALEE